MGATCPLQDLDAHKPVSIQPDPVFQAKESEAIELFTNFQSLLSPEEKRREISSLKKNVTAICNDQRKDYRK